MNALGILLIVFVVAICLFEIVSLTFTILKKRKLKKQQAVTDVNNVKQEDSFEVPSEQKDKE